jgi:phosphoenolpyruvate carboxykinase (GTP)
VYWFRKDEQGKFAWPGYGQNMRVLKWVVDRVRGRAKAVASPFGLMPRYEDLHWEGLAFDREAYGRISDIRKDEAEREVEGVKEWYGKFGDHLPKPLAGELDGLAKRVEAQPEVWSAK